MAVYLQIDACLVGQAAFLANIRATRQPVGLVVRGGHELPANDSAAPWQA